MVALHSDSSGIPGRHRVGPAPEVGGPKLVHAEEELRPDPAPEHEEGPELGPGRASSVEAATFLESHFATQGRIRGTPGWDKGDSLEVHC